MFDDTIFSTILKLAPNAIIAIDEDQRIILFNYSAEKIFGYKAEEVMGKPLDLLLPPALTAAHRRHTSHYMQSGQPPRRVEERKLQKPLQGRRKDGTLFPIEVSIGVVTHNEKRTAVAIVQDISQRVQMETELHERAGRFSQIFQSHSAAMLLIDPEGGQIVDANEAAVQFYGYSRAQLCAMTIDQLNTAASAETSAKMTAAAQWQSNRFVFRHRLASGEERTIEVHSIPIDIRGKKRLFSIIHDISEQVQAEEEIRVLAEQYETMISSPLFGFRLIDEKGIIEDVNDAYCGMTGYTREELLGRSIATLDARQSPEDIARLLQNIRETGIAHFETSHKTKGGRQIDVEITTSFWPSQRKYIAYIYNITERKQAQQQLAESEERFRSLIENSNDGIFVLDENGNVLYRSPAASRLTGYRPGEVPDVSLLEHIHPDDRPVAQEIFQKILAQPGSSEHTEIRFRHADGSYRWLEVHIQNLLHNAALRGLVVNVRDITARIEGKQKQRQLQRHIQAQELQLREIMEAFPNGVVVVDSEGRVLMVNPAAEEILHLLTGAGAGEVVTHVGDRSLSELLNSPPKGRWHEVKHEERVFEVIARPLHRGSSAAHWVLVITEVTTQRMVQAQLHQQERLAAVGQLASGIAHDFNNVMAVIVLYTQLLLRCKNIPPTERGWIETINHQAWHATKLIQQILDFSRQSALAVQPLNLAPLLKEHIQLLRRTIPSNIEIDFTYDNEKEYWLEADPTRLQQLIANLAINASHAMPDGGFLRFSLDRVIYGAKGSPLRPELEHGTWIKLTVSDTGTGMAPEVLAHAFEPFFTTKGPGQGTGLGLSQVHGIVSQHDGYIDVESEVGKGTTFTIHLPAQQTPREYQDSLSVLPEMQGHGEWILLVEDDMAVRTVMVQLLQHLNYRVVEAANGEEALHFLEKHKNQISLVLSDVAMPKLGGVALLFAMRERGWQTPFVLITGYIQDEQLRIAQTQKLSAYLLKPPDPDELAQTLAKILRGGPT